MIRRPRSLSSSFVSLRFLRSISFSVTGNGANDREKLERPRNEGGNGMVGLANDDPTATYVILILIVISLPVIYIVQRHANKRKK
jgi:hypothetical protein